MESNSFSKPVYGCSGIVFILTIVTMKTIDFSYFIERYLAGEMDDAEKEWFSKELEGNEMLRHEVELRRKTDSIIADQGIMNLRSKLNAIEKKRAESALKARPSKRPGKLKYAALLVILVAIAGGTFLFRDTTLSTNEIIEKYYQPYEAVTSTRSDQQISAEDYNIALEYYKIRDFKQAALYFTKVLETEPDNMGTTLLNGISNYEIKNYPVAELSFEKVITDNKNYYVDHAQWYLALCYMQTGEIPKARGEFSLIEKSNTIYSRKARKILRELK
jgi:tetratricopeptide (TPR) repeat protein